MNKIILLGRIANDLEVRYTQSSNTMIVNFRIAVNRKFKKEGEQTADFISVVCIGKTAEFCSKYFKKGQQIALVGRLQTRNYEDNNGQKHYIVEVVAEEVYFADSKKDTTDTKELENKFGTEIFGADSEDDLPW